MAFLVVGGITVEVSVDSGDRDTELIGSRTRAFDGSMRATLRTHKKRWQVRTVPITRTAANSLEAVLIGTPPVSCSGDLLGGTVSCHPELTGWKAVPVAGGHRVVMSFALHEV